MRFAIILKLLGILLMIFSTFMLPPIFVSLYYGDGATHAFVTGFIATFSVGLLCWWPFRQYVKEMKTRDGFLIVVLFWTVLSAFGAIPFFIATDPQIGLSDAIFESVSGLTTTGATVLSGLDYFPHAMLYYRAQLHFLGGMGIIVLAVAILPMLGIGGMQLYRAESPGPIKDTKLTPRITGTAKALWLIYVGLIIMCAVGLWVQGMSWFDAICESFSIVSTGGFSNHDASFLYYNNHNIDLWAIIFMIMGATNFSLHYQFFRHGHIGLYWKDQEFRNYLGILAVVSIIIAITLYRYEVYPDIETTLIKTVFTVVSLSSTSGFFNADYSNWPTFIPYLLMIVAIIGGCAASTSGGIKVIRAMLLRKQSVREIHLLIHPKAVIPIKIGDNVLSPKVIQSIWGYLGVFILLFIVLVLLLLADGIDITTAFGSVAAAMSNSGAAIGQVSQTFANLSAFSKWILIFGMVAGRLEIFSLLVIFSRAYWRE
ncbi:MAG: TrkH family potassium uptake protein [Pseudomonadota bacterium]|nr:TrkH family potassium uptake protein [Pseudomonadota bacterium]